MPTPPRGRIYDDITETIGGTPLVRLDRLARAEGVSAEILGKLEYFNPTHSVKDRIGVAMLDALAREGRLAPGAHSIQGIGACFLPGVLDCRLIDRVITIGNGTAFETARKLAALEGIPGGISSGAAVAAALELAGEPGMDGKRIVVILPSFAERYLSTALFDMG